MATPDSEPPKSPEPQQDKVNSSEPAEAAQPQGSDQTPQASESALTGSEVSAAFEAKLAESAGAGPAQTDTQTLHQHHISKILDEVLEVPEEPVRRFKHPMVLDLVMALCLLFAMAGFVVGLFKMYITHSAQQSILQHKYEAAIHIIKGAPLPGFIAIPGGGPDSDPQELLNQALYLDGMEKLDNKTDINGALNELQQIQPGSRFFALAQEAISENFEPSSTLLKMEVETTEKAPPKEEKKPFNPEEDKDLHLPR